MVPKLYYNIVNDEEEKASDVYIYGDITSWPWMESDVSAFRLVNQLNNIPPENSITVHINSYGGEVAEGLAIYNSLKIRNATTICDGFAASAASVIFMAGKNRVMNPASLLMIHNASTVAFGNSDDLEKAAEDLKVITEAIRNAYLEAGVSIDIDQLEGMMDDETWITPGDALAMNFATAVSGADDTEDEAVASARSLVFDRLTARPESRDAESHVLEGMKRINEIVGRLEAAANILVPDPPEPGDEVHHGFFNFTPKRQEENHD